MTLAIYLGGRDCLCIQSELGQWLVFENKTIEEGSLNNEGSQRRGDRYELVTLKLQMFQGQ